MLRPAGTGISGDSHLLFFPVCTDPAVSFCKALAGSFSSLMDGEAKLWPGAPLGWENVESAREGLLSQTLLRDKQIKE